MRRQDIQVFSKEWFQYYQQPLLWVANTRIGRSILGIDGGLSSVKDNKVAQIQPNNIKWVNPDGTITGEFRTHDKFGRIMYTRLKPLWEMLHWWDTKIANPLCKPELNFGFDTYTGYPDAGTGNTTIDGLVGDQSNNMTWTNIRSQPGSYNDDTNTQERAIGIKADTTSNQYDDLWRGIFLFDTSSIGAGASLTDATFSANGWLKGNGVGSDGCDVVSSAPASNNVLVNGDFDSLGSTSFGHLDYGSLSTSAYSDFTMNASGESAIDVEGITKYGTKGYYDLSGDEPTWSSGAQSYWMIYYADQSGTSSDPKLVVNYTAAAGAAFIPKVITT